MLHHTELTLNRNRGLPIFVIKVNKLTDFKYREPMDPPKAGNKFVSIEVEYLNPTEKPIECNMGDWKLLDQDGYAYDVSPNYKQPELPFTAINPGMRVKGWITFEVQKTATKFKAQFQPDAYSTENVVVILN
jgi:hypothetical protein